MMQLVSGDDIGDTAHAHLVLVGRSAAHPCRFVEIAQQRERGPAHGDEVFDPLRQGMARERSIAHVVILFKAFHRGSVGARDAQGAVGEYSLAIADVAEDFLGAPFLRSVAEVSIFFAAAREQYHGLAALLVERGENILTLHQGDVAAIIRRILVGLRTSDSEGWRRNHGWFQHRLLLTDESGLRSFVEPRAYSDPLWKREP